MDQLEIEGTDLYDGRHDFDASYFTLGELRTIKRISGLRRGELADAAANDDSDLWVAFAVIALQRKMDEQGRGETVDEDVFWNGRNVILRFVEDQQSAVEEDDAGPPVTGGPSSAAAASNGNSGSDSSAPSAFPVTVQQGTGTGSWDPSVSAPPTSPA